MALKIGKLGLVAGIGTASLRRQYRAAHARAAELVGDVQIAKQALPHERTMRASVSIEPLRCVYDSPR
jgi:hypothetical protein